MEQREWDRVRAAYDEMLVLPEAQRSVRLARIGQDDPRMRGMLDVLIHGDAIANVVRSREPNLFTPIEESIPPEPATDDDREELIASETVIEEAREELISPETAIEEVREPRTLSTPPVDPPRDPHEVLRLLEAESFDTIPSSHAPPLRGITTVSLWSSVLIIVALGAFALRRDKPAPVAATWLDLDSPDSASAHSFGLSPISLSPDGLKIAYVGGPTNSLFLRSLDDVRGPRRIEGSDNARCPSFSPDGKWIVFTTNYHLVKIPASGGRPVSVVDSTVDQCALWTGEKQILFERNASLFTVSPDGGAQSLVARLDTLDDIREMHLSQALPDGKTALVSLIAPVRGADWELGTLSLTDGRVTRLGKNGVTPRYAHGYLLYSRAGVVAAPFTLRGMRVTGPETRLPARSGQFTTSANERLAYMDDDSHGAGFPSLVAVDTSGHARPLATGLHEWSLGDGEGVRVDSVGYSSPRVSPDGQRVALELQDRRAHSADIWIYDLTARGLTRLANHVPGLRLVGWTKDSRRVVFLASDDAPSTPPVHVLKQLWDGTTPANDFIRLPMRATTFTMGPRHGFGAFSVLDPKTSSSSGHIWIAPLDSPSTAKPYVATTAFAVEPMLSHDGALLAYTSNASGRNEVYVRPLDASSPVLRISDSGAIQPVWSADDQHLYYRGPSHMMRATIARGAPMSVTRREVLFADIYERHDATNYDVMPGDKELLMIQKIVAGQHVGIVVDWPALLR